MPPDSRSSAADEPPVNCIKVFSATMARDRAVIGERVSEWLASGSRKVLDVVVAQSSDSSFHCISIIVFASEPVASAR